MVLPRLQRAAHRPARTYFSEFWALRDVNLEVKRGETVGIVGRNGSGKSTLLQMICGTLTPTMGTVEVRGRVAALLELGSGFNPEFTGRENVYLNASLLGLSRSQIDQRFDAIAAFADIGEFIEQPVKTYSSGMYVRLAFAVMAHVDAEILIIDEALAVGDAFFTQKCMRFLSAFKEHGTLLFVSHDSAAVTGLCDRALWLDHGREQASGPARQVVDAYLEAFMTERQGGATRHVDGSVLPQKAPGHTRRDFRQPLIDRSLLRNDIEVLPFHPGASAFGDLKARVIDVALVDEQGKQLASITGGEDVVLELAVRADEVLENAIVGFYFKDRLGQLLFGDNTWLSTLGARFVASAGETFRARFHFQMPRLQAGDYVITAGVANGTQAEHVIQHWINDALLVKSMGNTVPSGIIGVPMSRITLEHD
ncbi:MAG TPA: ABC transporter ATP-binding protein [Rhodanobacteraceae bacterium]|nr:ABC transporter ATP-binding protein [Rhodanobacteraceae bacterium]